MIRNLFSLPIYHINLKDQLDIDLIKRNLYDEFKKSSTEKSGLEHNGGVSTYSTNSKLHLNSYMNDLNQIISQHVEIYWKILDIDEGLLPEIDECWSNIHFEGSFTEQHSHSLMPVVATFYVSAEKECGDLIFINPMEYSITHLPYSVPIENKTESKIAVKTGDLILFPGFVRHKTGQNYSSQDRIVVSYNFKPNGTYLNSRSSYPVLKKVNEDLSEINYLQNKIVNLETIIYHLKRNLPNG